MLWHSAPLLQTRVTECFYNPFARDLGSVVALHDPVGFLSFVIVAQTVNVLNQNLALLIYALLFKAWHHWSNLIRG